MNFDHYISKFKNLLNEPIDELSAKFLNERNKKYSDKGISAAKFEARPDENDLKFFPDGTFFLSFNFKLDRHFMSNDLCLENEIGYKKETHPHKHTLYIDNIVKTPTFSGSSWKGCVRSTAKWLSQEDETAAGTINDLFGNELDDASDEDEAASKSLVKFMPTFFHKFDYTTICPLSNKIPVENKSPIEIQIVPRGSSAEVNMLYYPSQAVSKENFSEWEKHFKLITDSVYNTITKTGFGAKRSVYGIGTIKEIKVIYKTPVKTAKSFYQAIDKVTEVITSMKKAVGLK